MDRVPEELWTEVPDTVQEAVIKTRPQEKEMQKAKQLSEEALQIAEERRQVKGKGERERYNNGMGREEGGGFRMGNTCIPVVDSF